MIDETADVDEKKGGVRDTLEGSYDRIAAIETARKALISRKRLTLRLQICLSFSLIVLIGVVIAVALVMINSRVEEKLHFLEITEEFTLEIIQARRFEKNYFLYGTNLSDAVENVYKAREILRRNEGELDKVFEKTYAVILSNIDRYQKLLERLVAMEESETFNPDESRTKKEIELGLRQYGREMVSNAQELIERERKAVSIILSRSRSIHIYSLILWSFIWPPTPPISSVVSWATSNASPPMQSALHQGTLRRSRLQNATRMNLPIWPWALTR
jgi:two-component system, NtrC family, sensor kinase